MVAQTGGVVRLFIGSLMIFFGTLLLAALLALGIPGGPGAALLQDTVEQPDGSSPTDWRRLVAMVLPR